MRIPPALLLALSLGACETPEAAQSAKARECQSFFLLAREEALKAKAPPSAFPTTEEPVMQQRAERYRAYASALEAIPLKDEELKRRVGEYIAHVRGSAELFEKADASNLREAIDEARKRDAEGQKMTAAINTYCGAKPAH